MIAHHVFRKLASRRQLGPAEEAAILALPFTTRTVDPASYVVREGERPKRCSFLVAGYAYRQKLTNIGTRQIMAVHIPGDFIDLQNLFLNVADHNVQALTRATLAEIPVATLRDLVSGFPAIAAAMWIDALVEASLLREWMLNVGRRDARGRMAHLLCELAVRLKTAGVAGEGGYELPMTQEQIADALGLTPVHVNRVLKALSEEGLIQRSGREIRIDNWERLRTAADFNDRYLHLGQVEAG